VKLKDSIRNYALMGTTVFFGSLMMVFFWLALLLTVAALPVMLFTDLKLPDGALLAIGIAWMLPLVFWRIMLWSSRQPIVPDPRYAEDTKIYVIEGRRIS